MSVPCHVYVRVSVTSDSSPRLTILGQLTGKAVAPTPGVKPMLSGRGLFILAPATLLVESIQIMVREQGPVKLRGKKSHPKLY